MPSLKTKCKQSLDIKYHPATKSAINSFILFPSVVEESGFEWNQVMNIEQEFRKSYNSMTERLKNEQIFVGKASVKVPILAKLK